MQQTSSACCVPSRVERWPVWSASSVTSTSPRKRGSAQLGVPSAVVSIGLATNQLTAAQGAAVMASLLATLGACAVGGALLGQSGPRTDASAPVASA